MRMPHRVTNVADSTELFLSHRTGYHGRFGLRESGRRQAMNSVSVSLTAFIVAASALTITPGLDTALVLRTAVIGNSRSAALAGLGIALGCFCWACLVALGLGALLSASRLAYMVLRWIGAAYLVWTGYRMLLNPRPSFVVEGRGDRGLRTSFGVGAMTNLLNPKVGIFYVSFLPQFVPNGVSVGPYILLLGAIHAMLGLIWFACLILATRPIARLLRIPAAVRTCDRVTGAIFVLFGAGLALGSRRP
jgi:threonine/homoserine/homoserine lactone efflux protein